MSRSSSGATSDFSRTGQSSSSVSSNMIEYYSARPFPAPKGQHVRWPMMQSFAIEPNHPFVALWHHELRDITMSLVRKIPTWVSVDVLRRGYSDIVAECPPSIIVTVIPGTLNSNIMVTVDQLWQRFGSRIDFNIEVREGVLRRLQYQHLFQTPPPIGKSIGPQGTNLSGKSGGYVKIGKPGMPDKICALTCHHVGVPEAQGITPAGWADSSKVVVYPSDVDLRDTIEIARQDRDRESARLNSNITRAEGLLAAGMADERTTKALERDRIRAASAQSTLEALTSWESYYGRVFASSGFRVAPSECSLDWALVSVPRKSVNHLMSHPTFFNPPVSVVEEFARAEKGDDAWKIGRDTSRTCGRLSGTRSHCKFEGNSLETTEQFYAPSRGSQMFAAPGDSGAWVLNADGGLVGLLFGGYDGTTWSYVTPIEVVLESVRSTLGCVVSLPDENGR